MTTPLLMARSIVKRFGSVEALRGANFDVNRGEVVALVGDNGAGKSTLVKILSGSDQPTSGSILFEGEPVDLASPMVARGLNIETVYQDLALAMDLDTPSNLFLGREIRRQGLLGRLGALDKAKMAAETAAIFDRLGIRPGTLSAPVESLSGGQRQSVAVARAAAWATKLIFLDEPTAALGHVQTEAVLNLIRRVRDNGTAVVLISHNLQDVLAVSDRIEVLRLGRRVARFATKDATVEEVVAALTGGLIHDEEVAE
ncbi:MAG: ATP-binding cassette domain-containing protein [Propionicimonas sp.]|uniref:ATP-binding cassette domain-containing protein n=1 Tax=Propionicimonas sp. TaxID=1955623 RepID=UPI002B1EBB9C|nr:ATP-binding cassette domain-containing protein [Propionicimonas sp.]MEA4943312.1 ATP-binding cassette domain-containing protein [Propionicimonas sp.]MEA5055606.1 ATP-binding cassette domain-containing protein [Propionicimonas sp.]MEA5117844.1 ATP-binding cassette domain-containing protein [Propionicimonas sp.]